MRVLRSIVGAGLFACAAGKTVIIGDSLFAGGSKVPQVLEGLTGHGIENYAVVGASLHEGDVASVVDQYNGVVGGGAPTTVIMDGGGNDAFSNLYDCQSFNDHCRQVIDEAAGIASELLARMDRDGVQHVLYLGFYYVQGLNKAADYGTSKLGGACASAKVSCHFADVRNTNVAIAPDNMHPDDEGYRVLGEALWHVGQDHGVPI